MLSFRLDVAFICNGRPYRTFSYEILLPFVY